MSTRNYSIDILKLFCALLVVFIHVDFNYNKYILPVTRCAVPVFLIISGYFLYDKESSGMKQENIEKNIARIVKLTLWSTLFYFVYFFVLRIIAGERGGQIPSQSVWLKWICYNVTIYGEHLWYLFAYIYVLLIVLLANRFGKLNCLFYWIPILLLANLLLGMYSKPVFEIQFPYYYTRNFLLLALPFFLIGAFFKKHEDKILGLIKTSYLIGGVIFCFVMLYVEKVILDSFSVSWGGSDLFFCSIFLAVFLFLLSLSIKNLHISWIAKMGEKDSLYIYIFHPVVAFFCSFVCYKLNIHDVFVEVAPIVVIIITILLIEINDFVLKKIKFYKFG